MRQPAPRRYLPALTPLLALLFLALPACDDEDAPGAKRAPKAPSVSVRVFDKSGTLVGPVKMQAVRRTAEDWKQRLSAEQYKILRNAGTEQAFCGNLLDNKKQGVYTCAGCSLPLFQSNAKFKSGTGWPSFFKPIAKENIEERKDSAYGMVRTEILCARCEGHLGHVFDDGPKPTSLRYCLNSESILFTDADKLKTLVDPTAMERATAVFAGGCFWCVEAVFEELDGVVDAVSGYAGDTAESAIYERVSTGTTKHAEAVQITYNPRKISYEQLLEVHFATHDPTTLNRQGADRGTHYRSAIFYADAREQSVAKAWIAKHQKALGAKHKIVTTLEPLTVFYAAESKHQNFVCDNPGQGYVRAVAKPKVDKVRKLFKDRLKQDKTKPVPAPDENK